MGCVFYNKNELLKNEISLTPLPHSFLRKIKTDSYVYGLEEKNNSKIVNKNHNEKINTLSSLNYGPIKYSVHLKNGREMVILPYHINKLCSAIKGFLFRKKYEDYLKTQLMDRTNEIYFEFIIKVKNYKSSKLINSKNNEKIKNILKTSWKEFYIIDPTILLKEKINNVKKYSNGLLFKYKNQKFDSNDLNQCLKNVEYCYKGYLDIITNKKNGYGELTYIDGRQYIGTFYNDEFAGWNILVNNQGIIYVGLFNHDILNGKGLYYNSTNEYIYKGDFKDFKKTGYGEEISDGVKYVGDFNNDKKNGNGKIILNNNDIYKGMFIDDKFNGKGEYKWNDKKREYKGNFVDGKMNGNGFLRWEDDKYYKGGFINGLKEGKAEFGFINGCKFFFNFKNDLPCGNGYMQDKNNNLYEVYYNQGKIMDKNNNEIVFLFE